MDTCHVTVRRGQYGHSLCYCEEGTMTQDARQQLELTPADRDPRVQPEAASRAGQAHEPECVLPGDACPGTEPLCSAWQRRLSLTGSPCGPCRVRCASPSRAGVCPFSRVLGGRADEGVAFVTLGTQGG